MLNNVTGRKNNYVVNILGKRNQRKVVLSNSEMKEN